MSQCHPQLVHSSPTPQMVGSSSSVHHHGDHAAVHVSRGSGLELPRGVSPLGAIPVRLSFGNEIKPKSKAVGSFSEG